MTSEHTSEELEAIQAVVDRVSSYQESAPDGTVEKELRDAFDEAGIDLEPAEITTIADAIEAEDDDAVDAAALLG